MPLSAVSAHCSHFSAEHKNALLGMNTPSLTKATGNKCDSNKKKKCNPPVNLGQHD